MQTARATWILWLGCVWGAACAAEPKLQDTWYLDGERATWVLSFSDGKNFTLRAPDGRRLTSRYVSSSTELGMFYDPEALEDFRHFRYAFDGADLTLTPTAKDRRAAGSLLRELPPANDGEVRRWIREADWKARGGLPGAGGGAADLAALLEQARKDKTFHEQLAAANQSLVEGDYADAQRRFEWAKAVRPDDADVAERLRQSEALALLASGDRLKREGRAEEARRAWLQAVGRWPGLAQAVDERLAGRPGDTRPVVTLPPADPYTPPSTVTTPGAVALTPAAIRALLLAGDVDGALRQAAGGSALRLRLDELKRLEDAYLSLEGSVREARALADRADRVEGDNAEASRLRRDGEERSARYAASRARARRLLADRPNADLAEERAKAREEVAALAARLDEARAYFNRRAAEDDKPVADFGIIRIGVEGDKKRAAKWRALGEDAAALKRRVEDVSP